MDICAFQSTFPHGERRVWNCQWYRKGCFNPRSRTGNDELIDDVDARITVVSIHVPARGTTLCCHLTFPPLIVSIHVPARGTTITSYVNFMWIILVSIHVPARGTTPTRESTSSTPLGFNPRSRTGNDLL